VDAHEHGQLVGIEVGIGEAPGQREDLLDVGLVQEVGGALLEDNEVERELKAQVPHHPELDEDVVVVVVHLDLGLRVNAHAVEQAALELVQVARVHLLAASQNQPSLSISSSIRSDAGDGRGFDAHLVQLDRKPIAAVAAATSHSTPATIVITTVPVPRARVEVEGGPGARRRRHGAGGRDLQLRVRLVEILEELGVLDPEDVAARVNPLGCEIFNSGYVL